jgi:hypothetical protein
MNVLNLFFRAPGIGIAEPDVGGQKVLLVKQNHAVAKSMMKVIPEKVTEQLGLLRVIDWFSWWTTYFHTQLESGEPPKRARLYNRKKPIYNFHFS